MIFGFNTDIKHADTVYHVQSEVRQNDALVQTQVFVRGRCIGKRATSYAGKFPADSSDQQIHEMLKEQHRFVLEAIRQGQVNDVITATSPQAQPAAASAQAAAAQPAPHPHPHHAPGFDIEWTNAAAVYAGSTMRMCFRVTENGAPLEGVKLVSRLVLASEAPIYSQAVTGANGIAEIDVFLDEGSLHDAAVLVQASHQGKSATRKFRVHKPA